MRFHSLRWCIIIFSCLLLMACNHSVEQTAKLDTNDSTNPKADNQEPNKAMDKETMTYLSKDLKNIHENNELHVAMFSKDRFPYFFEDEDGDLIGSDVDMVYDIAEKLGVKDVVFDRSAKSYDDIIQMVMDHQVDLAVTKLSVTLDRAQFVLFSDPYLTLHQAALINRIHLAEKNKAQENELAYLQTSGEKIGVVTGTSYVEFMKDVFPYASIETFDEKEDMLQAARKGDITAAFYDEFELNQYMNENPNASIDLKMSVLDDQNDYLAIALPPESTQLQEWLNQYFSLHKQPDTDEMMRIYQSE